MTTAAVPPKSHPAPPEQAGCPDRIIYREVFYTNPTQPRPVRVTYAGAPDAFAVAALADALAATVADGVGLALLLDTERAAVGGSAVGAGTALDGEGGEGGAGTAVLTAVSGHKRSSK